MAEGREAQDWKLWGVFSVADHLRRGAFVADVLLYDRLVVPVPDERQGALWRKWERRWDPARQAQLLDVIDAELPGLVQRVPWTIHHDEQWRHYAKGRVSPHVLANATSRDVSIIQGVQANPDSEGQLAERDYLVHFVDPKRDEDLRHGVPPGSIEVVAAYGSRESFAQDIPVEESPTARPDALTLGAFAWPLMVPSNSHRSDVDLLKEAAELATREETRKYRLAYHQWRRDLLPGTSATKAAEDLVERIRRYHELARRSKIRTALRIAVLVLAGGAAGAIGALGGFVNLPVAMATGAGVGAGAPRLEQLIQARLLQTPLPEYDFSGALFHEARDRLGWY